MKVKKAELLEILSKVRPGVAKKSIVEQATHFLFTKTDVATFNDRACIIHPFNCDFDFSVKETDFYNIIDSMAEAEFDLELDGDNIKIKSKGTKATLSTVVGESAKVAHLIENIRQSMIGKNFWKPLPKDFTEGIYLCGFSASKDLSTGVRACCAVKKDGLYTTDNIRISIYIMESEMEELLLPAKEASELVKYPVVEYGVSENWAHFRTKDGIIFNCKIMKGEYPFGVVDQLLTEADVPELLSFPGNLRDNVLSIVSLAEGEEESNKCITVSIEKGRIVCKAEKERAQIIKTVESDYEGETKVFLINPVFFSQVLKHATSFSITDTKGIFNSGNFYHLLALPE
jgi:DNA polymerase III sliding clamp (beta) subunit (PCNA family)